ncbi:MAG: ribosome silencing factor, partial [Bacteroidetes bacterium]|nr:ribosome silencing factor [Bacteroidota bacterium]
SLAIVDELLQKTKQVGLTRPRVEGLNNAEWILLDYFDVVVHVMLKPIRSFYKIEKLWADAKFYKFNAETEKLNKLKPTDTVKILNSI